MTASLALAGWCAALGSVAGAAVLGRESGRRAELVARACHELRGPLTAARLGLHLLGEPGRLGSPAERVAAIDMELRRAGLALEVGDEGPGLSLPVDQLMRSARGGRGARGRGLAIVSEIAASHGGRLAAAPSARGARLALELPVARASHSAHT